MAKNEEPKITIESYEYINGKLVKHEKGSKSNATWQKDETCYEKESIGIGLFDYRYLEVTKDQDYAEEYVKINRLLRKYIQKYARENKIREVDLEIEFCNYGKTELVFVLTNKNTKERVTLLVGQPALQKGKVYEEGRNLTELSSKHPNIVAPIDYFSDGMCELYVTPYILQARCIASYYDWGMYVPEPYYRFENFDHEQKHIVLICMIARLVSYFDLEKEEGLAECKLGGGDFMLSKDWEKYPPTIDGVLKNMYFIAARSKIHCTFEQYLDIIRSEFSKTTIDENPEYLYINLRGRCPIPEEWIEEGITLGKKLIYLDNVPPKR